MANTQIDKDYRELHTDILVVNETFEADTLSEKTSGSGITVDGVLIKDGTVEGGNPEQELTATGAITITNGTVKLNHASTIIEATLPAPTAGDELLIVNSSASGTAAHTVTLPSGVTFDGTNNTATLNAPDEAILIRALLATRWYIIVNNGSVAFSSV